MAEVLDTIEVHKAVDDGDRFDTSAGDKSFTIEVLDTGEYKVIGEYGQNQFEQYIPATDKPFVILYDEATTNVRAVRRFDDILASEKFVRYIA